MNLCKIRYSTVSIFCFLLTIFTKACFFEVVFAAVFLQWATCRAWKWIYWQRFTFFHYAAHACCQGGLVGKSPYWSLYSWKHTCLYSALWRNFCSMLTVTAAHCDEFCCSLLEEDERGHVHFAHDAKSISVMSISRWVADLLSYPGRGVQRHKWSSRSRWERDGWEEDETRAVCLIFNQWSSMLLRPGGGRIKPSNWSDTDYGDA